MSFGVIYYRLIFSQNLPPTQTAPEADAADVNVLLYIGLGMTIVGLMITFVGIGEKGFQSLQLRLAGPLMVCTGVLLITIRYTN